MTTTNLMKRAACATLLALVSIASAQAHGSRAGDVEITHPYATPSVPGVNNGAAYIATLENTGKRPDRLLRVSTPAAARSEIHTMNLDAGGVMRMREADAIELTPGAPIKMRPGQGYHFMLMGLKQPLKAGESFPMTLEFERAGKVEVNVVVQVPSARGTEATEHKH